MSDRLQLEEERDDEYQERSKKKGQVFVVTRSKAIALVVIVVVIIIFIGVISGVFSARQARKDALKEFEREKRHGDIFGGTNASTTSASVASKDVAPTKLAESTTVVSPTHHKPTDLTEMKPWHKIRLPQNIRPIHYDFYLDPYLEQNTFQGNVTILAEVTAKSEFMSYILIHINDMNVTEAKVYKHLSDAKSDTPSPGNEVALNRTFEYPQNDFFIFELESELEIGKYVIQMSYNANFSSQLNGLYISTYTNEKGEKRRLATSDFEPTDARKVLPCFDEPAMKATFSTVIVHDTDYTALSNMPVVKKQALPNGRIASHFMKSVPMSTYLLAFIVCDFKYTNASTGVHDNITLRVWTSPQQVDQTEYALGVGKDIITYYEEYYDLGYPLPKQDMIAIPDFSSGAMENWGLITFRETALLFNEGVSAESNKQRVAVVVSHELAHQWFGNIVSPKWWNDLWLNEGFASFVEYLGVNHTHPDWEMMEQFLLSDLQRVFPMDALASSHPISVEVDHPKKIKQLFDSISYSKGASIIRMLEGFVGREKFKEGLRYYLKKYAFSNAETKDLWNALGEKAEMDVKTIMDTWTLQMGFPVVTIKRVGNTDKAIATQKHFLLDPNAVVKEPSPFNYKWHIPLTYVFEGSAQDPKTTWMNISSDQVEFNWPAQKWIKGNFKQVGFYRVHYDDDNWKALIVQLDTNPTVFTAADRSSLINDAFSLARAGYLKYSIALGTLQYLEKETDYVPWKTALNSLSFFDGILGDRRGNGYYQKFVKSKVKGLADKLGWKNDKNDSHINKYLRSSILSAACRSGDPDALANATQMFKEWKSGIRSEIDVDLRTLVYYYGIANTGLDEWQWLFNKFLNTTDASEKSKMMFALAGSTQTWILNTYLEYSLDSSKIRSQDAVSVIVYVASNPIGKYLAWIFVQNNWNALFQMFSTSTFRLTSLTSGVTQFSTEADLEQMKSFFNRTDAGTSENARNQAIEKTQANIEWLKKYEDIVTDWFRSAVTVVN